MCRECNEKPPCVGNVIVDSYVSGMQWEIAVSGM